MIDAAEGGIDANLPHPTPPGPPKSGATSEGDPRSVVLDEDGANRPVAFGAKIRGLNPVAFGAKSARPET